MTGIALLPFDAIPSRTLQMIIVRQLRAGQNVMDGLYKDSAILDHRFAVRLTRVVDEPRLVPLARRINHGFLVHSKEEGVRALHSIVVIPLIRLFRRNALAQILDDPRPLSDGTKRESAETLNRGRAKL